MQHGGDDEVIAAFFGLDAAAVSLGNAAGDGEPDAEATRGGVSGGIGAIEPIEKQLRVLLGNVVTGVLRADDDALFVPRKLYTRQAV